MREPRGPVDITERDTLGSSGPYGGEAGPAGFDSSYRHVRYERRSRRHGEWPEEAPGTWRRHHHRHFGPPFPFFLLFILFGMAHMGLVMAALILAMMTAALVVTAIALIGHAAAPALREFSSRAVGGSRRDRLNGRPTRYSPSDLRLPGPAFSAAGPDVYRQQLLEVLKDRFVRGEIALSEYEARVAQVIRDPSVKHLG